MFKSTKKHRKLFYPAGLLSLILLPIISISYIKEHDDILNERLLPVVYWYPTDTISTDEFSLFLQRENKIAMEHIRNLKYSDIYLTENDSENNLKIKKGQTLLKELVKSKDTTIGVHFHISNLAKFNYLIKVFNICKIEKANIYLPHKNDIWVLNQWERESIDEPEVMFCGGCIHTNITKPTKSEATILKEWTKKKKYALDLVKTHYLSIILFVILLILNIRNIRNQIISFKSH